MSSECTRYPPVQAWAERPLLSHSQEGSEQPQLPSAPQCSLQKALPNKPDHDPHRAGVRLCLWYVHRSMEWKGP